MDDWFLSNWLYLFYWDILVVFIWQMRLLYSRVWRRSLLYTGMLAMLKQRETRAAIITEWTKHTRTQFTSSSSFWYHHKHCYHCNYTKIIIICRRFYLRGGKRFWWELGMNNSLEHTFLPITQLFLAKKFRTGSGFLGVK